MKTRHIKIRHIIYTLLLIIAATATSSCTQPDGYIGKWFGSWYLEEMLIDGEIDQQYATNKENDTRQVMISFHGKIFNMAYLGGTEIYGSWSYAGEVLTLIANYGEGSGSDYPNLFNPFPVVMHLPADVEQVEITVTHIGSKTMQWQYIDQNGRLITYNFKKYPA